MIYRVTLECDVDLDVESVSDYPFYDTKKDELEVIKLMAQFDIDEDITSFIQYSANETVVKVERPDGVRKL